MAAREDNEDIDLYFWKEDYTEEEMQGMWANYKAYDFAEPFFKEGRGYLISYANNTTNSFSGKINDNSSYTLLKVQMFQIVYLMKLMIMMVIPLLIQVM